MLLDLIYEIAINTATYFKVCDTDGDEMLTLVEVQSKKCKDFEAAVKIPGVSIDDIVWVFADADADGDERVSMNEIIAELDKVEVQDKFLTS